MNTTDTEPDVKALPLAAAPVLVKTDDTARMLGMSKTAFKSHLASGRIGPMPIRFGRSVRFSVAELADWCAQGCMGRQRWVEVRSERLTGNDMRLRNAHYD